MLGFLFVCKICGEEDLLPSDLEFSQKFQEARGWVMRVEGKECTFL